MPYKDKEQYNAYQRRHYAANRDARRAIIKKSNAKISAQTKVFVENYKLQHPCQCGEGDPCCLDFHHIDGESKEMAVSEMVANRYSLNKVKAEVEKCVVLCRNCHAKLHHHGRLL